MTKGVQIAIATLSVFAGAAWLLTTGEGTLRYYRNVAEFASDASAGANGSSAIRVHGFVVAGSIRKDLPAGHVDFSIADPDQPRALQVRYLGIDVPDLFRDGAEVVVEGRLEQGTFLAERVLAKCPSKYESQPPGTEA